MRNKILVFIFLFAFAVGGILLAHPHFQKTVKAETQSKQVEVTYNTYPYHEAHLADVKDGFVFHCGRGKLNVSGGSVGSMAAGTYSIRAQASSLDQWTLYLLPDGSDDLSQGIKLETETLTGQPVAHHLSLDLSSGHDSTDGQLVLSVAFGPRTLSAGLGTL